jgi:hypothetical protein
MFRTRLLMTFAVLALTPALPGVALAQFVGINYFDNANSALPDGTVRITTPKLRAPATALGHGLSQCALIYVLKPDQQLAACCGCKLTPNALLKLSVNNNLLVNTLSAVGPAGTIAIIPSLLNSPVATPVDCNPGIAPLPGAYVTAWATHVQDSGSITESDFDFAYSPATATALWTDCTSQVLGNGSGHGRCSCADTNGLPTW